MNSLLAIVIVIQLISALIIIGLVLLQQGKGADMGAAFGSGASAVCSAPLARLTSCHARLGLLPPCSSPLPCC